MRDDAKRHDNLKKIQRLPKISEKLLHTGSVIFLFAIVYSTMLIFFGPLISIINPVILGFFVIITAIIGYYFWKYKLSKNKKGTITFLFIIWIFLQLLVITSIEFDYGNINREYTIQYQTLRDNGVDELNASWEIINLYEEGYDRKYGQKEIRIPSREIYSDPLWILSLILDPILHCYFINPDFTQADGFYKLIVVQNSGCCGEFASTVKLLIKDVTGLDTRVIVMEGKDHTFPEVSINDRWYVFDKIFTTQNKPIEAKNYSTHLNGSYLYYVVSDLTIFEDKYSTLREHGFSQTNLTITAIQDLTTNTSNQKPIEGAIVEIFSFNNSYDPLVNKGETDEYGIYSTNLRKNQRYLIIVKQNGPINTPISIGMKEIPSLSDYEETTIYLHKYG